jgi:broad specificity phosphatase PhoE
MRNGRMLLALLLTAWPVAAAPPVVTTIILVRHAEKAAPDGDPPLSDAGRLRARELARVLADAGISAIYTTQFVRTQQTAQPLAAALSLEPVIVETSDSYAADVVSKIMDGHQGQTILVTGHTNTIPRVLSQLGIQPAPVIPDTEFDDLFVCTVPDTGPPSLVRLRYGAPAR